MAWDYQEVNFDKEIDIDVDAEIELETEIDFKKDVDIDIKVDSDVDIKDNLTHVTVDAEAFGDNSLVEIDAQVLTTDYLSHAYLSIVSAVD